MADKIVVLRANESEQNEAPRSRTDVPPPGEDLAVAVAARLSDKGYQVTTVDLHEDYGWNWVCSSSQVRTFMALAKVDELWLMRIDVRRSLKQRMYWSQKDASFLLGMYRDIHAALGTVFHVVAWHDGDMYLRGDSSAGKPDPG